MKNNQDIMAIIDDVADALHRVFSVIDSLHFLLMGIY